jgi:hypothetical protein
LKRIYSKKIGQIAARHHLGIGNPLDGEGVKMGVHYMNNVSELSYDVLNRATSIMVENQKQINEMSSLAKEMAQIAKANAEFAKSVLEKTESTSAKMATDIKKDFLVLRDDMKKYIKWISIAIIPVAATLIAVANKLGLME